MGKVGLAFGRILAAAICVFAHALLAPHVWAASSPILLITEPAALQAAEAAGAGFSRWFEDKPGPSAGQGVVGNDRLKIQPAWMAFTQPLRETVGRIAAHDPQAGVGVARHAHRLFDLRWLDDASGFFELIGVVNRLDRRPLQNDACGETRLVYRLAYRKGDLRSRLPMTIAVELRGDRPDNEGSCSAAARLWQAPDGSEGARLGAWLLSADGPLGGARLARERIVQITVNVQSTRWPSTVRPDFGGHAEYVLRAFRWNAAQQRYEARALENTPDVTRLRAQPKLRDELLAWLRQPANLQALDAGTLQVPERYLASEAVSIAPLGLARRANRPFTQLFEQVDWQADLKALPESRTLRSPQAVLRRLDDLSCMGCHQSRSVAGFHLLGSDQAGVTRTFLAGNALALAHSPHLQDELARRETYVRASLSQAQPDPYRPPAETGRAQGRFGDACGLGDPGFSAWTCGAGLSCQAHGAATDERTVGVCMPSQPAVGALCEPARVSTADNPLKDRARISRTNACGGRSVCESTAVGFPGGMCAGACDPLDPAGTCGSIAILTDFNRCLAMRRPFGECLQRHTRPAQLRACSAMQPCRDDYLCAQTGKGEGACIPPYFLFQMRVDGHP